MPSDLEHSLVEGGLSAAAAKLISNAIDNAATGRMSIGRQTSDATPAGRMRLIDSDTRKYILTNLDYPQDQSFRESVQSRRGTAPSSTTHPYEDSQPAAAAPTLSTPSVKAGKYISVSATKSADVAQSEVSLRVASQGGRHARLNEGTGTVDAVPILVEVEPKGSIEASVEERPDATVIRIRLKT